MRIVSFRINNFRSIVDSGMNKLAYDNITALIGQNESGKTSVMEALYSFFNGNISENVLRSDLSLPKISCCFSYEEKTFNDIIDKSQVPEGFFKTLKEKNSFTITRNWIDEINSTVYLDDSEIINLYQSENERKAGKEKEIRSQIIAISENIDIATKDFEIAKEKKIDFEQTFSKENFEFEKLEASFKRNPNDAELKSLYESTKPKIDKKKVELKSIIEIFKNKQASVDRISEKAKYAKNFIEIDQKKEKFIKEIEIAEEDIRTSLEQREFASGRRQKRILQKKLDTLNKIVVDKRKEVNQLKKLINYHLDIIEQVFDGKSYKDAEIEVREIEKKEQNYLTLSEIGELLFEHIPTFEFFDDFSSLLPDKIDMEDIVNQNSDVEGYKAASNFLTISGLTSDFFHHKNNRILKQKIENLNGEVNVNFHEYWQQKIGKENKIRINFELEHYDFQNPDKKGKPYLEFWIKDDKERLYPKQRSRGVRWFLSFYLELKAKAITYKNKNVILLIDEPGVSLHARAQEDVLKVFEDIKENVQIIYTTHSPHLINVNKLYRLLAVQRAKEEDDYSETIVFDTDSLNSASSDTLSPIYTLMGTKVSEQQVIQKNNNVIVEDVTTYYYLSIFFKLLKTNCEVHFLPATNVNNVPTLVNILLGWKVEYIVLLDDDKEGNIVYNDLKKQLFSNNDEKAEKKMILLDKCKSIEDLFSTIDFKKYILLKRVGITESNSEYIEEHKLSRPVLASSFLNHIEKTKITINDFDEETRNNIEWIVNRIVKLLI